MVFNGPSAERAGSRHKRSGRGGRFFVSYRRSDSQHPTARMVDRFRTRFRDNQIFLDVHAIELGEDFIRTLVQTSDDLAGTITTLLSFQDGACSSYFSGCLIFPTSFPDQKT